MLNLIKADLYRITKGKTLWITLGIVVLYTVILGVTGSSGSIGVGERPAEIEIMLSGSALQRAAMMNGDILFYSFLPIIIIVSASDFTTSTVKNVLSTGISRTKYYFSKFILALVLSSILILIYVTIPSIAGTLRYGYGNALSLSQYLDILSIQLPIYIAVISIGIFISISCRKTAHLNAIYISGFIAFPLILMILESINSKLHFLSKYDLVSKLRISAISEIVSKNDILSAITFSLCVIIVTTVSGITLFRRSEIK